MIREAFNFVLIAAISFALAWVFVRGLEQQEFVDQARMAKHFEQLDNQRRQTPDYFSGGREVSSGMGYYQRKSERGR